MVQAMHYAQPDYGLYWHPEKKVVGDADSAKDLMQSTTECGLSYVHAMGLMKMGFVRLTLPEAKVASTGPDLE